MSGPRQYILLVEDDRKVAEALEKELESWTRRRSIEVLRASSAAEGLTQVDMHGDDISIVIAELQMADKSGSEFLSELSLRHPNIVSFLLSGVPDVEEIVKSLHANMFGLISKPWDSWNLRLELSMAYEVAENRRIGSRNAPLGPAAKGSARAASPALLHERD